MVSAALAAALKWLLHNTIDHWILSKTYKAVQMYIIEMETENMV